MSFETVITNAKGETESEDNDEEISEGTELKESLQILIERENPMSDTAEKALDSL